MSDRKLDDKIVIALPEIVEAFKDSDDEVKEQIWQKIHSIVLPRLPPSCKDLKKNCDEARENHHVALAELHICDGIKLKTLGGPVDSIKRIKQNPEAAIRELEAAVREQDGKSGIHPTTQEKANIKNNIGCAYLFRYEPSFKDAKSCFEEAEMSSSDEPLRKQFATNRKSVSSIEAQFLIFRSLKTRYDQKCAE